jgi:ATP-dependent protease HslVU (ClpYQ) ATPase subunit
MDNKRLPELTDEELDAILSKSPPKISETFREWMKADIAAIQAQEDTHDEFARIRAEDRARSEAIAEARRDRRVRERVLAEKRQIEGYGQTPA